MERRTGFFVPLTDEFDELGRALACFEGFRVPAHNVAVLHSHAMIQGCGGGADEGLFMDCVVFELAPTRE